MKFKGTAKYQVKNIFEMSGALQFGQSKHAAKVEAKANGAKGPTDYAHMTGIHSNNTYRAYFKTCTELLRYAADAHGIKKANQLTGEHVRAFLLSKSNVKLASFRRYCAGLTKFDAALSKLLNHPPQWANVLKEFRESAPIALDGEQPARAYRDPHAIVNQLDGDMKLAAELQWRAGLRFSEVSMIKAPQLKGITTDRIGKTAGMVEIKGKGGKVRIAHVPEDIYSRLCERLIAGMFTVEPASYRRNLRQAAHQVGQEYAGHGTHGLRWNYAQERLDELLAGNVAHEVALAVVSREMGHERASITLHYQRRC